MFETAVQILWGASKQNVEKMKEKRMCSRSGWPSGWRIRWTRSFLSSIEERFSKKAFSTGCNSVNRKMTARIWSQRVGTWRTNFGGSMYINICSFVHMCCSFWVSQAAENVIRVHQFHNRKPQLRCLLNYQHYTINIRQYPRYMDCRYSVKPWVRPFRLARRSHCQTLQICMQFVIEIHVQLLLFSRG